MPKQLRAIYNSYANLWWLPGATWLACIAAGAYSLLVGSTGIGVSLIFTSLALLSLIAQFIVIISHFRHKQHRRALAQLGLFVIEGGVLAAIVIPPILFFLAWSHPSADGFAKDLVIPDDTPISKPSAFPRNDAPNTDDAFQQALMVALQTSGSSDASITPSALNFANLHTDAPEILDRYLAASPAWRVFEENGHRFATRRMMISQQWKYNLHGYYTDSTIPQWPKDLPYFQVRFTIGLSGEPWARVTNRVTRIPVSDTANVHLTQKNSLYESRVVVDAAPHLVVELFEQSDARERRITNMALAHLESELAPLVTEPTWSTVKANLQPAAVTFGVPSLEMTGGSGIYDVSIRVNPGEPGFVYLKAFEITKNTPLSQGALIKSSNEFIGWANDPSEQFLSSTHIKVDEGSWGDPYAARFEVWFVPDSGAPERKLLERNFEIEGWQR